MCSVQEQHMLQWIHSARPAGIWQHSGHIRCTLIGANQYSANLPQADLETSHMSRSVDVEELSVLLLTL